MYIQFLGLFAGGLVIFASLPQIIKIIRTKSTKDISLPMYCIQNIGTFLWIIFGIKTGSLAIIITNLIYLSFTLTILYLKIKHG
jgi:MtN3 and saliva related transmembrane protein